MESIIWIMLLLIKILIEEFNIFKELIMFINQLMLKDKDKEALIKCLKVEANQVEPNKDIIQIIQ